MIKNRNISSLPARVYSDSYKQTGKFDPTIHAVAYQILNKNGSSGNQQNAAELGALGCIENTHKNYGSSRVEGLGEYATKDLSVSWVIVDINKIKGHEKIKNRQYDEPINQMFREYDSRIKRGKNKDSLVYQVDQNIQRPLTTEEIHELYDNVFGNGIKKTVYPPHSIQQDIFKERADFRKKNAGAKLIINKENLHTRFGKDKVNALGIDPNCKVVIDLSGYFATWQIKDELGNDDHWVETQNISIEKIAKDIIYGLKEGKRIWLPISTYIGADHSKIQLLKMFKNVNVAIIIDEPDYQVWKAIKDLLPGVIDNVIA